MEHQGVTTLEGKKRIERIENVVLFVFAVLCSFLIKSIIPRILFNIGLFLASIFLLRHDYGVNPLACSQEGAGMHQRRQIGLGFLFGTILFLEILLLCMAAAPILSFPLPLFSWFAAVSSPQAAVLPLLQMVALQFTVGFWEEASFRFYFWKIFEERSMPKWLVLLLITVIFTLLHIPGRSFFSVILVFLVSLQLGFLRLHYGEQSLLLLSITLFVYDVFVHLILP